MDISLFDYQLPGHLIAQFPHRRRDQSRLLVLGRGGQSLSHRRFRDVGEYLRKGDALVVNNSKVFKARLIGNRSSGAKVEILLVRRVDDDENWEGMARPTKRLKAGERIFFDENHYLELVEHMGEGRWRLRFPSRTARKKIIASYGHVPLPQYISRADAPSDIRRYQTVYADSSKTGAVAAPTAGFHFSSGLLKELRSRGITIIELTLHVGPGTFRPVQTENVADHRVDPEWAEISPASADQLNRVRQSGGRIFAVGTTSVRALESAKLVGGKILPYSLPVDLYIRPGYKFKIVDHLITNFHLPKSSLLLLVSAFAGRENIFDAYAEAIRQEYRFYSYGDAMLIL